jgi:hypothetical protein
MTPYIADLLTAFFAKTIELSFATVFVSFLGQVLSRRAFMKNQGKGITLAEMDMRSWVMQPGTMITHFEALKSSILSFLGVLSLVAAVVAMLYTTASESLVQPYLRYGPWEHGSLKGLVRTIFANPAYMEPACGTPITIKEDILAGSTCLQLQYAAHSYYNYQRYISDWSTISKNSNGSIDPAIRPKGFAMIYENTTVTAPWIELENSNVTKNWEQHQRIINNVTLALPHSGVPGAAWDSVNNILQPEVSEQRRISSIELTNDVGSGWPGCLSTSSFRPIPSGQRSVCTHDARRARTNRIYRMEQQHPQRHRMADWSSISLLSARYCDQWHLSEQDGR